MNVSYIECLTYNDEIGWMANYIQLNVDCAQPFIYTNCERKQDLLNNILKGGKIFGIQQSASHSKPQPYEKLYPNDRLAPKMIKIPLVSVYIPANEQDMQELMQNTQFTLYPNSMIYTNILLDNSIIITRQQPVILAEVYCISHRINESSFMGTYYYDKRKRRSPSPIWFPTYIGAKETANHIYDSVCVEKHLIQM